jgi:hypothetical protein
LSIMMPVTAELIRRRRCYQPVAFFFRKVSA